MFELPSNNAPQVRPEVVARIVEAFYNKGVLSYCDTSVTMDGDPCFVGHYSNFASLNYTKAVHFTEDERKRAFEEFRKKGYHIAYETWYSANCHTLWTYVLKETKDTPEDRNFRYIF